MVDVTFRFEKTGYETYTVVKTVHEKGKFQPIFPTRITFDTVFEVVIQDEDGVPVEGVSCFINDVEEASVSDVNGRLSIVIPHL